MTEAILQTVLRNFEKYAAISDAIWDHAELGFTEVRSSALLCDALENEGFTVTRGVCGMPTAFVAEWRQGDGGPAIGFLAEYDALPGLSQKAGATAHCPLVDGAPGHGCGHNAMGPTQSLAVSSLKKCLEGSGIPVTLKIFGTPAEEILAGKGFMVRAGLFEGLDAVIDCHSSSFFGTIYGIQNNALFSFVAGFKGRAAHAGSAPWSGRSAADAVELMHAGTERLREHMLPDQRVHWATMSPGIPPNIVPDRCETWYYIRSRDPYIQDLYERILNCAKGAALMTGTEGYVRFLAACHQRYASKALAEALYANIEKVGLPEYTSEEEAFAKELQRTLGAPEDGLSRQTRLVDGEKMPFNGASSDVGDVTLIAPTTTLQFPAYVPHATAHSWAVTACMRTSIAHKGIKAGASVIALTAYDILTKEGLLPAIRQEFSHTLAAHPFVPYLPDDAEPPLDWHDHEMEHFRPLLEEALSC